ncbi:MAG TPA: FAD-binding oxidoreductase [Candidatus Cybelea sp.]|nr:FAD-binding oxidoreductase [Candidatus Cybelea sp.]
MTSLSLAQLTGGAAAVAGETLAALRARIRGSVLTDGEEGYDTARSVWNGMIDRRPGVIVRCAGAADVRAAVDFARNAGAVLAVRGGGHNIAGSAVCDGGVMIDLTPMKSVRVDPAAGTARVEPGVTLGDFDREAQAFGLITPTGINSTTGLAGLTLGGGFGWISRKFGLTADNLISADVVTADGRLIRASVKENPDLFWALRGGGGNFGIVTSFEFRLHPLGPDVLSGLIVYPLSEARDLLRHYREIVASAPDELTCWFVMRTAPPLPFLPKEVHGTGIIAFAACYAGPMDAAERAMKPLRAMGKPIADVIGPHPFAGWQTALDPLLTPGARNYWKSHSFAALDNGLIDVLVRYASKLPSAETELAFAQLGGAINRVPADATAYPHRNVAFLINLHTRWRDPAEDEKCIAWTRSLFDACTPFATGGTYVNFIPEDDRDGVERAYLGNAKRLTAIKAKYDPHNLFRINQNIRPTP